MQVNNLNQILFLITSGDYGKREFIVDCVLYGTRKWINLT